VILDDCWRCYKEAWKCMDITRGDGLISNRVIDCFGTFVN
jgi:hypothetical protein